MTVIDCGGQARWSSRGEREGSLRVRTEKEMELAGEDREVDGTRASRGCVFYIQRLVFVCVRTREQTSALADAVVRKAGRLARLRCLLGHHSPARYASWVPCRRVGRPRVRFWRKTRRRHRHIRRVPLGRGETAARPSLTAVRRGVSPLSPTSLELSPNDWLPMLSVRGSLTGGYDEGAVFR